MSKEADRLKEQGNKLLKTGKYKEALEKYTKAISLDSSRSVFFLNRSTCYLLLGNPELGLQDAERAIKLEPKYIKAYHRKAKALYMMKRYTESLRCCEKSMEVDTNYKPIQSLHKEVKMKVPESEIDRIIKDVNSVFDIVFQLIFGLIRSSSKLFENQHNQKFRTFVSKIDLFKLLDVTVKKKKREAKDGMERVKKRGFLSDLEKNNIFKNMSHHKNMSQFTNIEGFNNFIKLEESDPTEMFDDRFIDFIKKNFCNEPKNIFKLVEGMKVIYRKTSKMNILHYSVGLEGMLNSMRDTFTSPGCFPQDESTDGGKIHFVMNLHNKIFNIDGEVDHFLKFAFKKILKNGSEKLMRTGGTSDVFFENYEPSTKKEDDIQLMLGRFYVHFQIFLQSIVDKYFLKQYKVLFRKGGSNKKGRRKIRQIIEERFGKHTLGEQFSEDPFLKKHCILCSQLVEDLDLSKLTSPNSFMETCVQTLSIFQKWNLKRKMKKAFGWKDEHNSSYFDRDPLEEIGEAMKSKMKKSSQRILSESLDTVFNKPDMFDHEEEEEENENEKGEKIKLNFKELIRLSKSLEHWNVILENQTVFDILISFMKEFDPKKYKDELRRKMNKKKKKFDTKEHFDDNFSKSELNRRDKTSEILSNALNCVYHRKLAHKYIPQLKKILESVSYSWEKFMSSNDSQEEDGLLRSMIIETSVLNLPGVCRLISNIFLFFNEKQQQQEEEDDDVDVDVEISLFNQQLEKLGRTIFPSLRDLIISDFEYPRKIHHFVVNISVTQSRLIAIVSSIPQFLQFFFDYDLHYPISFLSLRYRVQSHCQEIERFFSTTEHYLTEHLKNRIKKLKNTLPIQDCMKFGEKSNFSSLEIEEELFPSIPKYEPRNTWCEKNCDVQMCLGQLTQNFYMFMSAERGLVYIYKANLRINRRRRRVYKSYDILHSSISFYNDEVRTFNTKVYDWPQDKELLNRVFSGHRSVFTRPVCKIPDMFALKVFLIAWERTEERRRLTKREETEKNNFFGFFKNIHKKLIRGKLKRNKNRNTVYDVLKEYLPKKPSNKNINMRKSYLSFRDWRIVFKKVFGFCSMQLSWEDDLRSHGLFPFIHFQSEEIVEWVFKKESPVDEPIPKIMHDWIYLILKNGVPRCQRLRRFVLQWVTFFTTFFHFQSNSRMVYEFMMIRKHLLLCIQSFQQQQQQQHKPNYDDDHIFILQHPFFAAMFERILSRSFYDFVSRSETQIPMGVGRQLHEKYGLGGVFRHGISRTMSDISIMDIPSNEFTDGVFDQIAKKIVNFQSKTPHRPPTQGNIAQYFGETIAKKCMWNKIYPLNAMEKLALKTSCYVYEFIRKEWGNLKFVMEDRMESLHKEPNQFLKDNDRITREENRKKMELEKEKKLKKKKKKICHVCGEKAGKYCSGCRIVSYCSVKCQKEDWKTHKSNCGKKDY